MSKTPRSTEEKMELVLAAWTTLEPAKSFGGMTLDQFKAKIKPSQDARAKVLALTAQITAALNERDDADKVTMDAIALVVNGVKADPSIGDNGKLYEAMGYVRKSERGSGLSRKKAAPKNKEVEESNQPKH